MYPKSKGLVTFTNLSTTWTFQGCGLCDIIMGLSVEMSTGPHVFILHTLNLENNISQAF